MFNQKKKYFIKKLEGVQKMIWDLEFKTEKVSVVREGLRREYDGAKAKLESIENRIKTFPIEKTKWTDEQKRVEDEKNVLILNIEGLRNGDGSISRAGYKDHLRDLDLEINGSPKNKEFPEGLNGIVQQIVGLRELQGILKMYIKKI